MAAIETVTHVLEVARTLQTAAEQHAVSLTELVAAAPGSAVPGSPEQPRS